MMSLLFSGQLKCCVQIKAISLLWLLLYDLERETWRDFTYKNTQQPVGTLQILLLDSSLGAFSLSIPLYFFTTLSPLQL